MTYRILASAFSSSALDSSCSSSSSFFFFKQKTAYEIRRSDWSSDVCSSDLKGRSGVLRDDPVAWMLCRVEPDGGNGLQIDHAAVERAEIADAPLNDLHDTGSAAADAGAAPLQPGKKQRSPEK